MTGRRSSPLRVRDSHVTWVSERLTSRDRAIIATLDRVGLATGLQLEHLHFSKLNGRSRSVVRWRVLRRLVDWRVLRPLERRVGGSLAGSAQMVFTLDSAGLRLARDESRSRATPLRTAGRAVTHRLGVTALYVELVAITEPLGVVVEDYTVEPACWVPDGLGSWLKPDAYARLARGGTVDHWWVEHDTGTEDPIVLTAKLRAYAAFYQRGGTGPDDVVPWVLFSVPDRARLDVVERLLGRYSPADLFQAVIHGEAAVYMVNQLL